MNGVCSCWECTVGLRRALDTSRTYGAPPPSPAVPQPPCPHCGEGTCDTDTTPHRRPPTRHAPLPAGGSWSFMPAGLAAALEGLR